MLPAREGGSPLCSQRGCCCRRQRRRSAGRGRARLWSSAATCRSPPEGCPLRPSRSQAQRAEHPSPLWHRRVSSPARRVSRPQEEEARFLPEAAGAAVLGRLRHPPAGVLKWLSRCLNFSYRGDRADLKEVMPWAQLLAGRISQQLWCWL